MDNELLCFDCREHPEQLCEKCTAVIKALLKYIKEKRESGIEIPLATLDQIVRQQEKIIALESEIARLRAALTDTLPTKDGAPCSLALASGWALLWNCGADCELAWVQADIGARTCLCLMLLPPSQTRKAWKRGFHGKNAAYPTRTSSAVERGKFQGISQIHTEVQNSGLGNIFRNRSGKYDIHKRKPKNERTHEDKQKRMAGKRRMFQSTAIQALPQKMLDILDYFLVKGGVMEKCVICGKDAIVLVGNSWVCEKKECHEEFFSPQKIIDIVKEAKGEIKKI